MILNIRNRRRRAGMFAQSKLVVSARKLRKGIMELNTDLERFLEARCIQLLTSIPEDHLDIIYHIARSTPFGARPKGANPVEYARIFKIISIINRNPLFLEGAKLHDLIRKYRKKLIWRKSSTD
jgi:hypothetical protein